MKFVRILAILALGSAVTAAQTATRKPAAPDLYLITIDTLRADHLGSYGNTNVQTPQLDGLAKDGVRFAKAFTPSPITNTSHTTILTGLLPSSHGVTDFGVPLAPDHATLAESLKKKGYHTAAFIGAVILDSKTLAPGLDRGFDFYDNFPEHPQTKERWGRVERRAADVSQHAQAWLTEHPAGPRFVWLHFYDPHDPYEPPAPYSQTYKDRPYDGEIAYTDSVVGNFLSFLKKRGWYDNAVIVVVGDHGEGLGEHHEETHGIFLYDSTTHVPLIVKLPAKVSAGKVIDSQVRTTDIMPTALDLLRGPVPAGLDGASLKPYLVGVDKSDRTAIGETDYPLRFGWAPLRSVRTPDAKFIEAPRPELYDLKADPGELKNTYEANSAAVQKFKGILAGLKNSSQTPAGQDASQTNNLQALGYAATAAAGADTNAASLPDPKDRIEEQNLLHTAMLASDDNRPDDARIALEKVLKLDPKSPTALRQLGELEFHAGEYAKAAEHLKGARQVRPEDSTAALYEGQAREKIGDLAGSRDALEASLKLTPGQADARALLGNVYLGLKDPKAAADQFEAALLIDPKNVPAQLGSAKVQIASGDFAAAVQQLEPLSSTQATNAEVFELLAQAYGGLGKSAEAQQAATRAKSLRAK